MNDQSSQSEESGELPILFDVVRHGKDSGSESTEARLTEDEIRSLARQVIEEHSEQLEEAIVRAIRTALDRSTRS